MKERSDDTPRTEGDAAYLATQQMLMLAGRALVDLDLRDFLDRLGMADAVGAVVDPTLYRRGHERLAKIRALAEAGVAYQRAFAELRDLVAEEEGVAFEGATT